MLPRREIRTLQLQQPRYFDDRLWPIVAALLLLTGVSAAMAIAQDRFEDPSPWRNTWIQLMAIGCTLGVSLWALRKAAAKYVRRYQLSVVLSLFTHVALALLLHYQHMKLLRERIDEAELARVDRQVEQVVLPEVVVPPPDAEARQEIEKPVHAGTPQLQTDQLTQERSTPKQVDAPYQPQALPEAQPQLVPHTARLREPQESIANRASSPGMRSRRDTMQTATAANSAREIVAAQPPAPARDPTRSPAPQPLAQPARAESVKVALVEPDVPPELPVDERVTVSTNEVPRRDPIAEVAQSITAESERRRRPLQTATIAADEQRVDRIDSQVSVSPQSDPQPTHVERELLPRSQAAAPLLADNSRQRLPDVFASAASQQLPRQQSLENAPTIARDASRQPARRRVELAANLAAEAVTPQLAEQNTVDSRQVSGAQPTNPTLARASHIEQLPASSQTSPTVNMNSPGPTSEVTPTRVTGSSQPSLHAQGEKRSPSRRSLATATLATAGSVQLKDVPAARADDGGGGSGAPSASAPTADLARTALSRVDANLIAENQTRAGSPETRVVGSLAEAELPRRQEALSLRGAQAGGSTSETRRSRAPQPAAPASAEIATLDTVADVRPVTAVARAVSSGVANQEGLARSAPAPSTVAASIAESTEETEPASAGDLPALPRETIAGARPSVERTTMLPRRRARMAAASPALASAGSVAGDTDTSAPNRKQGTSADVGTTAPSQLPLRRTAGDMPVSVDDLVGIGGLASNVSQVAGLPDRRARRHAIVAHATPSRQIKKHVGGRPSMSGLARVPAAAFSQRGRRQEELLSGGDGKPSAKTEAAIELGLEFLARMQLPNGRWGFHQLNDDEEFTAGVPATLRADAAATGLALLAFLGAGYDHFDDRYQESVGKGLQYLVSIQKPSGEIFPESGQTQSAVTRFYSHGIAALAVCEAFGMTGDPGLKVAAQRALDYISETQHPQYGGWRYTPGLNSDLSVTGWQLMALRSGELAGLEVSRETYARIRELLEACRERGNDGARFRYNPWASATNPRTRHGRNPSTVMTAVGLLAQLYLGSNRDDRLMQRGADHLAQRLPEAGPSAHPAPTGTLGNPMRDTYYWYYATQVMFHMGGSYWQAWNDRLHPLLLDSQTSAGPLAGSWNPHLPVPDKWASYGGRLYVTAMNLLSLEVYYRHLPLYEMTAQ